jgi:Ca-activated chloride channel family protein
MKYIILLFLFFQGFVLYAQQEKSYINKGNQLYKKKDYTAAEENYRKSLDQKKQSLEGSFNLGDALYKQKNYVDAAQKFTDIAESSTNSSVKGQAYHNLGNSLLEQKKLKESIDAYKKSLMNNPKDDQTRYNLAYAMEKLKQQQQQDKKDKDKDKNKDKNKDKDKKDQDKDKDKKDPNKDKKDQDKNKDPNKPDKDQNKDQNGQQPDKLSKEEAERMLQALANEEKNTQDKLKKKKATGVKGRIIKDW